MNGWLGVWTVWLMACAGGPSVGDDGSVTGELVQDTGLVDTSEPGNGAEAGAQLDAWCVRWKECGGTVYETAEDCVQATLDYWGDCAQMLDALDSYAECMIDVPCMDYDPDTLDPSQTACAGAWSGVLGASCP